MRTFTDSKGLTWSIVVNVGTAKAVRDITTVDIFNLYSADANKLFSDPVLLVQVIYVLCKEQLDQRHITEKDFCDSLTGDAIENAATALLQAVSDFFPSRRRTMMEKILQKSQAAAAQLEAETLKKIDSLNVTDLLSPTKSQAS